MHLVPLQLCGRHYNSLICTKICTDIVKFDYEWLILCKLYIWNLYNYMPSLLLQGLSPGVGSLPLKGWPLTVSCNQLSSALDSNLICMTGCMWPWHFLNTTGYWPNSAKFRCASPKALFTRWKSISTLATATTAAHSAGSGTRQPW